MNLNPIDLGIIALYLIIVSLIGFWVKKRATKDRDSFFLADRNVPWWMLGFAGCSSYIDIGGTMSMVGLMFYLGLKGVWVTHFYWGLITIAFYMAYQAKYIRLSGVMTFAEWNATRFGDGKDAEKARFTAALFLLVLMVFNIMLIAVGTGKFVAEFLPFEPWISTIIVFAVVGIYVTLGGFMGVILTDVFQTILIMVGAIVLGVMAFTNPEVSNAITSKSSEWSSMAISWTLWDGFKGEVSDAYKHFYFLGPILLAGVSWVIFRILAGPNVWDFQFFLTPKNARESSLAAGMWTVGYTFRWILILSFLLLGMVYLGTSSNFDAEKILPRTLRLLPVGVCGAFLAVMLAALMSTISAMINVISSSITNDFIKRYWLKDKSEKQLVGLGQIASILSLAGGFLMSLFFKDFVSAWEVVIFVVVTMILVPATFRWHWWRFGAMAFVWGVAGSCVIVIAQKIFFPDLSNHMSLLCVTIACVIWTVIMGFVCKPADTEILVRFYSRIRPFGVWGPIRKIAAEKGLVPSRDKMPAIDLLNGFLCTIFQSALAIAPFYFFLKQYANFWIWMAAIAVLCVILYYTWYKNLPAPDYEETLDKKLADLKMD